MSKEEKIILNEDCDEAYGLVSDFDNIDDFQRCVHNFIKNNISDINNYELTNIKTETFISSSTGVEAERFIPINKVNFNINTYYHCEIEEID